MRDLKKEERRIKREIQDAKDARCAYCGKEVGMEDRCQDGIYLHRECATATSQTSV